MRSFRPIVLGVLILSIGSASCGPARTGTPIDEGPDVLGPGEVKPLEDTYRKFVAALVALNSLMPAERAEALRTLESLNYKFFEDDGKLIQVAVAGDDKARLELARRGKFLNEMFVFWERTPNPAKWDEARRTICALGPDARAVLIMTLLRMLLNGLMRDRWPAVRYQLVEIGDDARATTAALLEAKIKKTPPTPIFKEDDLVQPALVILGFGEKGRADFTRFTGSENPNVRKALVRAVGEAKAADSVGWASERLASDPEWFVRAKAAWSLGQLRPARDRAGAALLQALRVEKDMTVRPYIAEALGELEHVEAVPDLVRSLELAGSDYAEKAIHALYRITGQRLFEPPQWKKWLETEYPRWKQRAR